MMLGLEDLVEDGPAVGAEIIPAAPVLPEQVFADLVGGDLGGSLSSQLLGDRFADEFGERCTASIKTRSQFGLDLHWQSDGYCHG